MAESGSTEETIARMSPEMQKRVRAGLVVKGLWPDYPLMIGTIRHILLHGDRSLAVGLANEILSLAEKKGM